MSQIIRVDRSQIVFPTTGLEMMEPFSRQFIHEGTRFMFPELQQTGFAEYTASDVMPIAHPKQKRDSMSSGRVKGGEIFNYVSKRRDQVQWLGITDAIATKQAGVIIPGVYAKSAVMRPDKERLAPVMTLQGELMWMSFDLFFEPEWVIRCFRLSLR